MGMGRAAERTTVEILKCLRDSPASDRRRSSSQARRIAANVAKLPELLRKA
jgi:hypothetical protein